MGCLVLAGENFNLLELAQSVVASSADPLFPATRLYDGQPWTFFRFGAAAADSTITADLERLKNGGFESWASGAPVDWSLAHTGGGSVSQETTNVLGGTSSARLSVTSNSDVARITQLRPARAGERFQLSWGLYGQGGTAVGGYVNMVVRNLHTGHYLAPGGTWSASPVNVATRLAADWETGTQRFNVESFSTCRRNKVTLYVELNFSSFAGAVSGYVDNLSLLPAVNLAVVYGHNFDPILTPTLQNSNSDTFAAGTIAEREFKVYPDSFYQRVAADAFRRYWRLKLAGGPNFSGVPWIGEWILGQAIDVREPERSWEKRPSRRQVRHITPAGVRRVYSRTVASEDGLRLRFGFVSVSDQVLFEQEVIERSQHGELPLVIVPYYSPTQGAPPPPTDIESTVVHGTIDADWPVQYTDTRQQSAELVVAASAFPPSDELA